MKITKAQQVALKRVFDRGDSTRNPETFLQFRRRVQYGYDCIMIHWCNMWLGIETDGHTHS